MQHFREIASLLREQKGRRQPRKWRMIQLVQIGILLSGGLMLMLFHLRPLALERQSQALSSLVSLTRMRGDELIDVVYVYANKTHPRIIEEYQNLAQETTTDSQGFLRSPPTNNSSVDMDLMYYSVRMLRKMGKNLGSIFIVVKHEEELSLEIKQIPGVKVILESQLYEGTYFSAPVNECSQHRIPNLGTFYIAMNDDMVIAKPLDLRTFFFSPNGSPRTMGGADTTIESIKHKGNRLMGFHKGGQLPQIKYTLERLSGFVDVKPLKHLYPAHFPRPFHREFIQYVQSRDSVLFQSPFSKRFRCQKCLNVFMLSLLHSYETGGLRQSDAFGNLAYIDSPSAWKKVLEQWDGVVSITFQEVSPNMQATVSEFLGAKSEP
jgi:hypothetical protein